MSSFSHPSPGLELDWLAVDLDGCVGLFSAGAGGPVPEVVVEHLDQVDRIVEELHDRLPIVGPCAVSPSGPGTFEYWIEPCRRGLFGFDWEVIPDGRYARLTVPSRPIAVTEIGDAAIRATARLVQIRVRFVETIGLHHGDLGVPLYTGGPRPRT